MVVFMESRAIQTQSSAWAVVDTLRTELNEIILGQNTLIDKLLIALLSDGHLLVEGAPGLAKTKAVKSLASFIEGSFHRIQFTPDLLPSDLTGTDIYRPEDMSFIFQEGPLFHNVVLADEINRAPAKVQSALLEAMAERQVTIGKKTYPLPPLFLVMATQNPIEQEGTYPLPEAQLDRFMMHVTIGYPQAETEHQILKLSQLEAEGQQPQAQSDCHISQSIMFKARHEVLNLHVSEAIEKYLVSLVLATRNPKGYSDNLARCIQFGASPRATIALDRGAKAHAWLNNRDYVTPEDIHAIIHDILRHRLILTYEAEAKGITPDLLIDELLNVVAIP